MPRARFLIAQALFACLPVAALLWAVPSLRVAPQPDVAVTDAINRPAGELNVWLLAIQVGSVLVLSRLFGKLFKWIHQPPVIGEIMAGIALGPSVMGWLFPQFSAALFPTSSLVHLQVLSQAGLVIFMFLVGMELDPAELRGHGKTVWLVSQGSICIPFALGIALSTTLYPLVEGLRVSALSFTLFIGAAMSITAVPVLARILAEQRLTDSRIGHVSLTAAAVNDVVGWVVLACVVAMSKAQGVLDGLTRMTLGTALYVGATLVLRKILNPRFERAFQRDRRLSDDSIGMMLVLALASAAATEWLGIHALFGALLAGVAAPKNPEFVKETVAKLEPIGRLVLLPLFFAVSGIRTDIGHLSSDLWGYVPLVVVLAAAGKIGGAGFGAYMSGLNWRDAAGIGVLMNTRGLMELVALNIGLEAGLISRDVFTIFVFMALITTMMTSPLLRLVRIREVPARVVAVAG